VNHTAPHTAPSPAAYTWVLDLICAYHGISNAELTGQHRSRPLAYVRHTAAYLLRQHTPLSLADIGTLLGGREHSTVAHSCHWVSFRLLVDPALAGDVQTLSGQIHSQVGVDSHLEGGMFFGQCVSLPRSLMDRFRKEAGGGGAVEMQGALEEALRGWLAWRSVAVADTPTKGIPAG
jgi:hypothetical protein